MEGMSTITDGGLQEETLWSSKLIAGNSDLCLGLLLVRSKESCQSQAVTFEASNSHRSRGGSAALVIESH